MHGYEISTDAARLDVDVVADFLHDEAYWSLGVPRAVVERGIANSLCFGLYAPDGAQAGFARVVTDRAQFAYIADVFVLAAHRGRGLGVWLMEVVMDHPDLQGLRRTMIATADAHALYTRFGFEAPRRPELLMELMRSPQQLWGTPPADGPHEP